MALTPCKHCGKAVSDKAHRCPHCGNELNPTDFTPVNHTSSASPDTPQLGKPNAMRWILIAVALCVVTGIVAGYLYCDHLKTVEAERIQFVKDSIIRAELEQARLDSIRQDSIVKANRVTRDLALFELKGQVKSVKFDSTPTLLGTGGKIEIEFDQDGTWSNQAKFRSFLRTLSCYEDAKPKVKLSDSGWCMVGEAMERDEMKWIWSDHRITESHLESIISMGMYDTFDHRYQYQNDAPFLTSYTYIEEHKVGMGLWTKINGTATMKYNEYDSHGNWISRTVTTKWKSQNWDCDTMTDSNSSSKTYIETRTITYYE